MSDYIPFEIQVEIIKKVPAVKSLLQFRSVSKRWKSLIDSSEFIAGYNLRQTQAQGLLVLYEDDDQTLSIGEKNVSLVDHINGTFSQQEFVLDVSVFKSFQVVGSSLGLLCLCNYYEGYSINNNGTEMAVLWNPSIRKSVGIAVPAGELGQGFDSVLGFGVCPITSDPVIVKIFFSMTESSLPLLVEIFTLSTGCWRIPSTKLPNNPIRVSRFQAVIDRFIYWYGSDYSVDQGELILSFDMTTQEFSVIDLPFSGEHAYCNGVSISKVGESLAVLEYMDFHPREQSCNVYIMDHGVPNTFTLLFNIYTPYAHINILGFTKSGEPVMETRNDYDEPGALVVYDPRSGDDNVIGIYGKSDSFFVGSYVESLLLLDKEDNSVYPEDNGG